MSSKHVLFDPGHVFIDFISSQVKKLKLEVGGMLVSILTCGDDHMIG
jgi:hypothetical protein